MKTAAFNSLSAVALLAICAGTYAANPAPAAAGTAVAAPKSGTQMGHSPADGKAMRMMPPPGQQAPEPSTPAKPGDYPTMGHSPADGKAMRHMEHGKAGPSSEPPAKMSKMPHSKADAKAMAHMTPEEKAAEEQNEAADKPAEKN